MMQLGTIRRDQNPAEAAGEETWPSLTPFAFGRAQDSGNGKNPCAVPILPQLKSIVPALARRNAVPVFL